MYTSAFPDPSSYTIALMDYVCKPNSSIHEVECGGKGVDVDGIK